MITAVNSYTSNYNPSFGTYFHTIKNAAGEIINRGDTCIFRPDLPFDEAVEFFKTKYKNLPKVNVIAHACSDGEEVYSFLMRLRHILSPEEAKKFLPVMARDVEQEHIDRAVRGIYELRTTDICGINFYAGGDYKKFFDVVEGKVYEHEYRVKDDLRKDVIFKRADIIEDMRRSDLKNTILFARNVWPYLTNGREDELAEILSKKADKSFTLLIGDYDKDFGIDRLLNIYGFKESCVENIFEYDKPNPLYYQIYDN